MKVPTRYGIMAVLANDLIASKSLQRYGEWAQAELDLLGGLIDRGMTVIDGGAYIGSHTLAFSHFVGPAGRVHAVEANPDFFAVLQENVAANAAGNVTCYNIGLSDTRYEAFIRHAELAMPANFGGTSLLDATRADVPGAARLRFVTLDGFIEGKVDLIKLDIEGMECLALRGATQTLARWRPTVYAECNDLESGVKLLVLMRAHGYTAFGCLNAAFNRENFNAVPDNMFGDAKEIGLLLVHETALPRLASRFGARALPAINTFDDLALLLYHKPQYPGEVLARQSVGRSLGLDYPSPRARALEDAAGVAPGQDGRTFAARLAETDAALAEAQSLAYARADEIAGLSARLAATDAALAEAQSLAYARADEIADLSARLSATDAALAEAQALAHQRRHELDELAARLSRTLAELGEAQTLATARTDEIEILAARSRFAEATVADLSRVAGELTERLREATARAEETHAAFARATRWRRRVLPARLRPSLPTFPTTDALPGSSCVPAQRSHIDLERIAGERDRALLECAELKRNLDRWRAELRPFPEHTCDIPEWMLPRGAHIAAAPQRYTDNYPVYVQRGGKFENEDLKSFLKGNPYFVFDRTRFYFFNLAFDQIAKEGLGGDFAELGVDKGASASVLARAAERLNKAIYLLDTFEGFSPSDLVGDDAVHGVAFADASLSLARSLVDGRHVRFIKGYFPESAAQMPDDLRFCLVHLDCDLYKPFASALEYFWPRLVPGGFLIMHDYTSLHWDGVEKAVDSFFAERLEAIVPVPDMAGTVAVRKSKLVEAA